MSFPLVPFWLRHYFLFYLRVVDGEVVVDPGLAQFALTVAHHVLGDTKTAELGSKHHDCLYYAAHYEPLLAHTQLLPAVVLVQFVQVLSVYCEGLGALGHFADLKLAVWVVLVVVGHLYYLDDEFVIVIVLAPLEDGSFDAHVVD